jgi:hypothetical protein
MVLAVLQHPSGASTTVASPGDTPKRAGVSNEPIIHTHPSSALFILERQVKNILKTGKEYPMIYENGCSTQLVLYTPADS